MPTTPTHPSQLQRTAVQMLNLKTEHFVPVPAFVNFPSGQMSIAHTSVGTLLTSFIKVVGGEIQITNQRQVYLNIIIIEDGVYKMEMLPLGKKFTIREGVFVAFDSLTCVGFLYEADESVKVVHLKD